MNKNTIIGISLWLEPPPGSLFSDALQSTINSLRPLFDDAPGFAPHITITSNISISAKQPQLHADSILDRALAAARSVPHLDVVFSEIKFGGSHYFKKVYFKAKRTPELLGLAMISREEFVSLPELRSQILRARAEEEGRQQRRALTKDEEDAQAASEAARIAADWAKSQYDPHVSLIYSDAYPIEEAVQQTIDTRLRDVFGENYATKGIGWTGGRLTLVRCEGPVEDWQILGHRDIQ